jgi:hypothetical protein
LLALRDVAIHAAVIFSENLFVILGGKKRHAGVSPTS